MSEQRLDAGVAEALEDERQKLEELGVRMSSEKWDAAIAAGAAAAGDPGAIAKAAQRVETALDTQKANSDQS